MKKYLHILFLSISFWLLFLHNVVPHHHLAPEEGHTAELSCTLDQGNQLISFFQNIFHTNVGADHLEHLVEAASNSALLLSALLLVAVLPFLNLLPEVKALTFNSEVTFHDRPLSPSIVYWQQSHFNLPPPARS